MHDVLPIIATSGTLPRIAWDSVLDAATITCEAATESDGAVEQVADWRPWSFFRPTDEGEIVIEADLGGSYLVNGMAISGHDAEGLVGVDSWDGADWQVIAEEVLDGDGAVAYLIGDAITTTKLRFRFESLTFLAVLWAGNDLVIPEGCTAGWTDPLLALRPDLVTEQSRDGAWLGNAVQRWGASQSLSIKNLDDTWVRDEWLPFLRRCAAQPFFLHWNTADWPTSACLCTGADFGSTAFSSNRLIDVSVTAAMDPGFDRILTPDDNADALLLEDGSGALLLEG